MAKKKIEPKNKGEKKEIMGKNVCIVLKKELSSTELKGAKRVTDDFVIRAIRAVKEKLNMATKNRLYVSAAGMEEYKKRRKSFEKGLLAVGVLAVLVFLGLVVLPLMLTGQLSFGSLLLGLVISFAMVIFFGFIKYVPGIER